MLELARILTECSSEKKKDRVLELTRRSIACWKLEKERKSVRTYKKIDSVLEVRRSKIEC